MDVIEDLIKKRNDLFKQVEAIDTVLEIYGHNALNSKSENSRTDLINVDNVSKIFPIKAKPATQVLWLFRNTFTHSIKLREVQISYDNYTGSSDVRIDNVARRLKKDKKLVIVKYNDKNILSYWGLPEWIDGNDFKTEFKPDAETMPDEITSSEVVTGE
ncbi:hypothetical protein [Flavobacterium sp. DSP2-3-1]|uniref:hypothetical protein n=1 Tax=Flavobacterium sp. DSP2-3-1 TaxID=2804620 RepID=UPI003CFA71B3